MIGLKSIQSGSSRKKTPARTRGTASVNPQSKSFRTSSRSYSSVGQDDGNPHGVIVGRLRGMSTSASPLRFMAFRSPSQYLISP